MSGLVITRKLTRPGAVSGKAASQGRSTAGFISALLIAFLEPLRSVFNGTRQGLFEAVAEGAEKRKSEQGQADDGLDPGGAAQPASRLEVVLAKRQVPDTGRKNRRIERSAG